MRCFVIPQIGGLCQHRAGQPCKIEYAAVETAGLNYVDTFVAIEVSFRNRSKMSRVIPGLG